MRWKATTKPRHKNGDTRERVVFAWYPLQSTGGTVYWLERVLVVERYFCYLDGVEWEMIEVSPRPPHPAA